MKLLHRQPTTKAPGDTFTGDAWFDVIIRGEEPSRVRVSVVRFAPGARNAWHAHSVGQTVHVTEGVGLIQSRGESALEIHPGDTVFTPAGEWHWHRATADHFMTHLAIWEASADGAEANWGELVTDAKYAAAAAKASR
jgi:quercetin dioxygenase-like cupin family protein